MFRSAATIVAGACRGCAQLVISRSRRSSVASRLAFSHGRLAEERGFP
jgi:hypothetical protein